MCATHMRIPSLSLFTPRPSLAFSFPVRRMCIDRSYSPVESYPRRQYDPVGTPFSHFRSVFSLEWLFCGDSLVTNARYHLPIMGDSKVYVFGRWPPEFSIVRNDCNARFASFLCTFSRSGEREKERERERERKREREKEL